MSLPRFTAWLLLLTILVPLPLEADLTDPALRWRTVFTKHFAIHFYEGEEELAKKLETITEEVFDELSGKFNAPPWGRTEVVVVDNHDLANGFTLVIPYNIVVLRAVPPISDSTLADYDDWLRMLFTHEYTHVIHISDTDYPAKLLKFPFGKLIAFNGLTPGWVTEGLATYFETVGTTRGRGQSSFTEMLLRTDILRDRFLHLDQMAGTMYDWPSWQAQYLYGVGFWKFLSEKYGEETLIDFSHKYGSSFRFFMINSHAKRVWKRKMTPEEEKLCAEDHWADQGTYQVKTTYPETCGPRGLSFYKLWSEWREDLSRRFSEVKEKVEAAGLREGEELLVPKKGESFSLPTFSPDGKQIAYLATSVHHPQQLRLRDLEGGKERVILKKKDIQQIGFSPDGGKLIVSNVGSYKRYNQFSDLHEITLETGKVKQLTHGKRARDPDYSPDGKKIVAVIQETGRAKLGVYDPESKEWKEIFEADQFDHPRWMPDGRHVVVSIHKDQGRDLWMIDSETGTGTRITKDRAIDDRPTVDRNSGVIYFSSDVSGIPNIYRYDNGTPRSLKKSNGDGAVPPPFDSSRGGTKKTAQVSNVLTGAFAPSISPDGTLVYQYYTGKGFEIRTLAGASPASISATRVARDTSLARSVSPAEDQDIERRAANGRSEISAGDTPASDRLGLDLQSKKYNPFRKLFIPRYLLPNISLLDGSIFSSLTLSNFDPLSRHYWFGDVTYRSDNDFVGFDVGYTYSRFRPALFVGYSHFSVDYGDVFGFGTGFFEARKRVYGGVAVPMGSHRVSLQYFFEDRSEQSGLPAGTTLSTLGRYAGVIASYHYKRTGGTVARISPESGEKFSVSFEFTDHVLGSSEQLEQRVIWGDVRKYIRMPYSDHHVVALRAAGGYAFGDQLLQGNFGLGGAIGESPFVAASTRVFTLRGLPLVTFSRDRAWVASAEYRFPLFRLQRGPGTLPFALNSAHFALFADIGDAFNRGNPSFRPLLGVGAEIRGDFIVAWHLPVTGRLGYGVILTNRDRIAGVRDSLTGADARNGVVILEIGTSF